MTAPQATSPSWPSFARQVIDCTTRRRDPAQVVDSPSETREHGGVFVTLHKLGRLRGCMGILDPKMPLVDAVRDAAVSAASRDPRFPSVSPDELAHIEVEVSIMSHPHPMRDLDELQIGRHGVLVRRGMQRGLFLPQVAVDHHLDKEAFLSRCCSEKAGLPADAWKDPSTEVLIFTTEVFRET